MTLPKFEPIEQALRAALATLDATTQDCQAIADTGEGYVCAGCPAEVRGACRVQEVRLLLREVIA